jgi:GNAT superfamily N-acetyltransferase
MNDGGHLWLRLSRQRCDALLTEAKLLQHPVDPRNVKTGQIGTDYQRSASLPASATPGSPTRSSTWIGHCLRVIHPDISGPARLTAVSYDHGDAVALTQALYREQLARYGFADDPTEDDPQLYSPPIGGFLVGYLGDELVGCGGWRMLAAGVAEIKRMYVVPSQRRTDVGRGLLRALEAAAGGAGARRIVLETGSRNDEALGLYQAEGYRAIPSYVAERLTEVNRAFEKILTPRRT